MYAKHLLLISLSIIRCILKGGYTPPITRKVKKMEMQSSFITNQTKFLSEILIQVLIIPNSVQLKMKAEAMVLFYPENN